MDVAGLLAAEFGVRAEQAGQVVRLIDEGNTIPFIARYRKEATGSLDDQLLREMGSRLDDLRGLDKRREEVSRLLAGQENLTPELSGKIAAAVSLTELEDIYRPFRKKRRTRAAVAREAGLEPLAQLIAAQRPFAGTLAQQAESYADPGKGVPDVAGALAGARDIIAETLSDDADLRGRLREAFRRQGRLQSAQAKEGDSVYRLYYDFAEPVSRIPAHRILAVNRGEREGYLKVRLVMDAEAALAILKRHCVASSGDCAGQLALAAEDAWGRLIGPSLERELRAELSERAEDAAARVFGQNLRQLLMQPPVKGQVTLGVDPGFRTGCKLAVIDENGRVLETGVGYFTLPAHEARRAKELQALRELVLRHGVKAVAIGNGTASREAEAFIAELLREVPGAAGYAVVSEAGASVYSASRLAAEEFPQFDVTLRSAVSIARRLQDPLAELVKIDPRSIGVGQYQHDIGETRLATVLDGVVESCVNAVGVELHTASPQLLSRVAGIGPALARSIAAFRDEYGIRSRSDLKKVPKLGPRAFEQCAGFLRVRGSEQPLDATGVHPESYPAARALILRLGFRMEDMKGDAPPAFPGRVSEIGPSVLAEELGIGLPTLQDIVRELMKPGRDPREELPPVALRSAALCLEELSPGMELEGTVRNVVDFGAFVDIGVHQDGLVHVSRMADRYVRHPSEVVRVGDLIRVWVLEVDAGRKRIALSMLKP